MKSHKKQVSWLWPNVLKALLLNFTPRIQLRICGNGLQCRGTLQSKGEPTCRKKCRSIPFLPTIILSGEGQGFYTMPSYCPQSASLQARISCHRFLAFSTIAETRLARGRNTGSLEIHIAVSQSASATRLTSRHARMMSLPRMGMLRTLRYSSAFRVAVPITSANLRSTVTRARMKKMRKDQRIIMIIPPKK